MTRKPVRASLQYLFHCLVHYPDDCPTLDTSLAEFNAIAQYLVDRYDKEQRLTVKGLRMSILWSSGYFSKVQLTVLLSAGKVSLECLTIQLKDTSDS